jgi:RHS repeat-associated protein
MFRKLINTVWMVLLCACCQLAAAAPSVSVTATPSIPTAPATVTLAVTVTPDAEPVAVTQVEYFNGTTSLGMALQAPYALTLENVAAGTYQIVAKVSTTDASNPLLQSAPLAVTVGSAPGTATAYFIHTDQLNTPRAITNAGGAMVWQWDSDPFGKDSANEQPAGQPAFTYNPRFPGQQFDRESNLHYNYYRDYDPQTGRYIQSDPIGLLGGINTFAYVESSPLSKSDPTGEFVFVAPAIPYVITGATIAWRAYRLYKIAKTAQAIASSIDDEPDEYCAPKSKMKNQPKGDGSNMPGDPQAQNRQARDAANKAGLSQAQRDQFHHAITGQNFSYQELVEIAKSIKNGSW